MPREFFPAAAGLSTPRPGRGPEFRLWMDVRRRVGLSCTHHVLANISLHGVNRNAQKPSLLPARAPDLSGRAVVVVRARARPAGDADADAGADAREPRRRRARNEV